MPLLARRGGSGTEKKTRSDLMARDGVVAEDLEPPPRPLHQRRLRDICLDVASTPAWPEGQSGLRNLVPLKHAEIVEAGELFHRGNGLAHCEAVQCEASVERRLGLDARPGTSGKADTSETSPCKVGFPKFDHLLANSTLPSPICFFKSPTGGSSYM